MTGSFDRSRGKVVIVKREGNESGKFNINSVNLRVILSDLETLNYDFIKAKTKTSKLNYLLKEELALELSILMINFFFFLRICSECLLI